MNGGATMSRAKKAKGKPDPDAMTTRAFRMRQEYADWLERLATFDRSSIASLLDRAVTHYGKAIGFNEEAPER
jgi:hypothetical protein